MEKSKKIALVAFALVVVIITIAMISFSGGKKPAAPSQSAKAPNATKNEARTDVSSKEAMATANQSTASLQPLPADDKAAVDSEIANIDKDLTAADEAANSTDLSNASLGL